MNSEKKNVLLCDDDQAVLDAMSELLQNSGYAVSTAHEHTELMQRLNEGTPDLIILDVRMPERDGIWVAECLQALGSQIPVLFLTGCDSTIFRLYAPFVGAVGYFLKPVNAQLLLQKIKSVFDKTPQRHITA